MEFSEFLGRLRKERAALDLKLENKELKSADEGRNLIAKADSEIEATQAAIQKTRIDLVKRYSEKA